MSRSRSRNRNRGTRPPQPADSHIDTIRPFRFKHNGQTYEIPPASVATENMDAGALIDMARDGSEAAQMRFFVAMLDAADIDDDAMAALRSMSIRRFGSVMQQWATKTGGHPGKSEPSSDS